MDRLEYRIFPKKVTNCAPAEYHAHMEKCRLLSSRLGGVTLDEEILRDIIEIEDKVFKEGRQAVR